LWAERVHPEDRALVASMRGRQRAQKTDLEIEYRLVAADGRSVWVREFSRVAPGEPARRHGVLVNINRRKRAERRLYLTKSAAESQVRELSFLQDSYLRLSQSIELPQVLQEVIGAVTALQGTEMGSIRLYDPGRGELQVVACVGLDERFIRPGLVASPA